MSAFAGRPPPQRGEVTMVSLTGSVLRAVSRLHLVLSRSITDLESALHRGLEVEAGGRYSAAQGTHCAGGGRRGANCSTPLLEGERPTEPHSQ